MVQEGAQDVGDLLAGGEVDRTELTHEAAAVDGADEFTLHVAGAVEAGDVASVDLDVERQASPGGGEWAQITNGRSAPNVSDGPITSAGRC